MAGRRRHSKGRDANAISHHYDVSNRFYEWVLGPTMAYTCACYPHQDATLEQAQGYKFDLVARKLGLAGGMRLLDVGCGWGGMVMHAAREYGARALGVTLSAQQAAWAQAAIERDGLSGLAEVRHLDYRDVPETGFDAVSSIGLTEHVGKQNLPGYFAFLLAKLRPGGRLLNHCITRPDDTEPAIRMRGFINRYVFPDGELEGPGYLISLMHDTGFEVRHEENLREHYARTLAAWSANLDAHWDQAVAEVGQGTARVWRLYMAGCGSASTATTSSCTRCSASNSTPTAPPACRCAPTGKPRTSWPVNWPNGPRFSRPRRYQPRWRARAVRPARTASATARPLRSFGCLSARSRATGGSRTVVT